MAYTPAQLELMASDLDPDWFAIDAAGAVGHFTCGGTAPVHHAGWEAVKPNLDTLYDYFRTLPKIADAVVNPRAVKKYTPRKR